MDITKATQTGIWKLADGGKNGIGRGIDRGIYRDDREPFSEDMEMAGNLCAVIVYYGRKEDGTLFLHEYNIYPTLRTIPNHTHGTLRDDYLDSEHTTFTLDGEAVTEYPDRFEICGRLSVTSSDPGGRLRITRVLFPAREKMAIVECITVTNVSDRPLTLGVIPFNNIRYSRGTKGVYKLFTESTGNGEYTLAPGEEKQFGTVWKAGLLADKLPAISAEEELEKRDRFVRDIFGNSLVLDTPDPYINCEFRFAKLRASESIFDTAGGPMHCPGGRAYYAAIWANDQCEYAAPYFGYSGYDRGIAASENTMKLYRPFMHPDYEFRLPSSIIAEGRDIWEGAGDEGDASMCLYGLSRFILETGDTALGKEYFDFIDWCVGYIATQETEDHVIHSDNDELEGRFSHGEANLLVNSLSYGGLVCASSLARSLGYTEKADYYAEFASRLRDGIENYFGREIRGYHTYRYHDGCEVFRSYLCSPMTVGIYDRAAGTAKALLDHLKTPNGFLSSEEESTFWDRSTLYAFRGIFSAGCADEIIDYFADYSKIRLTGIHVPYPMEAWPEGDGRHLSAESGLYARTLIEGVFGISPASFTSFTIKPSIPSLWDGKLLSLRRIKAFGEVFDVELTKNGAETAVKVTSESGKLITCTIPDGEEKEIRF